MSVSTSLPRRRRFSRAQLDALDREFESAHPTEIIQWATATFGKGLCLATSFADTLLVDLATSVDPDIPVVFSDTGFHFAETLDTMRRAQVRYQLDLVVLRGTDDRVDVWQDGVDACCAARKVAPFRHYLRTQRDAWLSGLRRSDSAARSAARVIDFDADGLVKINPIAGWSDEQVDEYITTRDVLVNPLAADGYASIGCWPCTEPADADDPRAGRWAGMTKTECGLHL
ncbi:MAG: phosphoadenylyl-sulfate reductase [Acidimicrobiia bacterium]|nr:phosphoadenylyl-sulfate reductase [Acidimicrobiia bacterium]